MGGGAVWAQETKKLTGKVVDEDGLPVIGALITVDDTKKGASTNNDGEFVIANAPANAKLLRVSCVGMEPRTVAYKEGIVIVLQSSMRLDELMVVAYGTAKRSAFTGSITEVKSEEITNHISSTATSALVGKVAGMQGTQPSGEPGSSAPTLRVRGIGSLSATSTPLYIIDGAPMDAGVVDINPSDIESISVLKDASASAIYGARGANGVIIITTKKAKGVQDAEIKLDAKWGSNSRLMPHYDVISDPGEYYATHFKSMYNSKFYNGASADDAYAWASANLYNQNNGGLGYQVYTVPEGQNLIGRDFSLNPNAKLGYSDGEYFYTPDNWYDETFHSAFRQEYNVSATGSTDRLKYFASVGYLGDGGYVNNSDYNRYSARTNVDYRAKKWLTLSTNMGFTHSNSQKASNDDDTYGSSGSLFYICNNIAPIYPLYVRNADGTIKKENGRTIYDSNQTNFTRPGTVGNAVRDNEYNDLKQQKDVFMGKWQAVITPIEGLNLTANLSAQSIKYRINELYSKFASASAQDGIAYVRDYNTFSTNQQYLASYTKTFAKYHSIDVLAGYEQYNLKIQSHSGQNDHLFNPTVGELSNASGTASKSLSSYTDNYMTEGFLSRVQYNFDERYFFSGSYRRDASSRFAPGHRWGDFYSIGLAWNMARESFIKDIKWINLLKLKVSYGEQGNDMLDSYHAYADMYSTSYNEETGEYQTSMVSKGNENLTWETSRSWNAGVDFSFFKYRFNGTIEVFNRNTTDMLFNKPLPLSSTISVSSYPVNIGSMYNRGVEITLDGSPIKTRNIEWNINLNMTHYKNKITELDPSIAEEGLKGSYYIRKVGGTAQQAYMKKYAGVDKDGRALYYMDETVEVDGKDVKTGKIITTNDITKATQYDCGTVLPKLYGGFGTTLNVYNFDLSAQFSYQLGGKMYDATYQQLMHNGQSAGTAMHRDLLKAWSPENKTSNIPRLSTASTDDGLCSGSQTAIDYFLTSSNYLTLNNVTLGYTFDKKLLRNSPFTNIRVYVAGENLFVLSARKGMDPRYNLGLGSMTYGTGLASSAYAGVRNITAGLSVKF